MFIFLGETREFEVGGIEEVILIAASQEDALEYLINEYDRSDWDIEQLGTYTGKDRKHNELMWKSDDSNMIGL